MTNKNDKAGKSNKSFDDAFDNISNDSESISYVSKDSKDAILIDQLSNTELAQFFSRFGRDEGIVEPDDRGELREVKNAVIIPIGFPATGKSMWLSSLFWYASSAGGPFSVAGDLKDPIYSQGQARKKIMEDTFANEGDLIGINIKGTLDIIGLNITPNKSKIPTLKLTLLDLAGEDISKIEKNNGKEFTNRIETVFNGLQVNSSRVIFVLLTPFNPAKLSTDSKVSDSEGHNREDNLHLTFLQYLSQKQPNLYANSTIFMIVSQWDTNSNPNLRVEDYIKKNRPKVFSYIQNKDVIYGEYSIGRILTQSELDGTVSQRIVHRDKVYPYKFWKEIYFQITGRDLDKKPWWQRLFS